MKRILVPTDFSEVADNAFVHALELAKKVQGELVLLHTYQLPVIDTQYFPDNYLSLYDSLELSQFDAFKDQMKKLRTIAEERNLQQIKMTHRLMYGDLLGCIKTSIKEDNIDLVVMGTSGASGWKEIFIGTNTGEVLISTDIPVLSVPSVAKYDKIETIGFTTRYREKDKAALLQVLEIAKRMKATVKCLYVRNSTSDVALSTIAAWEKEFTNEPIQFFVIPSNDVSTTILDFISHQNIDLLAMTTYKRGFFSELFSTHFTERMTYHADTPILVLHDKHNKAS